MTRITAVLALLLGATLPGSAQAQSWSDFGSAFPLFPCQDGWVGCLVEGRAVTPEMANDTAGLPNPSDLRVGWFDLQPTASFSPFVSLSEYTGEVPGMAAAAVEEPPEPLPPPEPSAEEVAAQEDTRRAQEEAARVEAERRKAEQAAKAAAAEQEAQRRAAAEAAKRRAELEAQAQASADAAEADRLRKQAEEEERKAREAEEARKRAEAEAKKREEERLAAQKAEEEARRKAEEEAARLAKLQAEEEEKRRLAAEKAAAEAAAKAEAEAKAKAEAEAEAAAAQEGDAVVDAANATDAAVDEGDASCEPGDLVRLEPMAMLGKMSLATIKACEVSLGGAAKMTDKEKISRVLMVNAFSKGDKASWEQLVKRHLDEIDQSDPDLCYKYALHLSKQGPGRATGVIRWANVALENRTVWTGDTYTSRVYSLYKLRAAAAQQLWQKAESDHASSPTDATKKKVDDYRSQTKVLAREWYEYAKVAGKDTTKALQLCMSAAGTADYCEAQ